MTNEPKTGGRSHKSEVLINVSKLNLEPGDTCIINIDTEKCGLMDIKNAANIISNVARNYPDNKFIILPSNYQATNAESVDIDMLRKVVNDLKELIKRKSRIKKL